MVPVKVVRSVIDQKTGKLVEASTETGYLAGGIEGPWWTKRSWWVIPLGVSIFIVPGIALWLMLIGIVRFPGATPTPPTSTSVSTAIPAIPSMTSPSPSTIRVSGQVSVVSQQPIPVLASPALPANPSPSSPAPAVSKSIWDLPENR